MRIRFACPVCDHPSRADLPGTAAWQCPACDHVLPSLPGPEGDVESLGRCRICGNPELYKKKAFPHWLGLSLLTGACIAFLLFNALRQPLIAWGCLLGSALIDGILYLCVGDAVVCYACGAHHSAPSARAEHKPFELMIAERYRQEKLRRRQLETERRSG